MASRTLAQTGELSVVRGGAGAASRRLRRPARDQWPETAGQAARGLPGPAELRRARYRLAERPLVGRLRRRPALWPDRRGAEGLADPGAGGSAAGVGQRQHHDLALGHAPLDPRRGPGLRDQVEPDRGLPAVHPAAAAAGLHRQRPPRAGRLLRPRPVRQEPRGAEGVGVRGGRDAADLAEARLTLSRPQSPRPTPTWPGWARSAMRPRRPCAIARRPAT